MFKYNDKIKKTLKYRFLNAFVAVAFVTSMIVPPQVQAQTVLNLPAVGSMVMPTPSYIPALIKGITIHPENPLEFDFIVEEGEESFGMDTLRMQANKMIKYFLATLTVPEDEMWVNLSPYEKDRMIPKGFGETGMGRDLLAQDYILKQLTASLMYPEKELGQKFWSRVYQRAREEFGTSEIPMNTFNKIWIVPQRAVVYEKDNSAFVIDSHLKVLLEEDYVALKNNMGEEMGNEKIISGVQSSIIEEIIIPEIEKEVNNGESFAALRQIYNSVILATWFKNNLKESLLGQIYVDQNKTKGIDLGDKHVNEKIYEQYLEAFSKGVYNYIREDVDPVTKEIIPRKYFSGGTNLSSSPVIETIREGDLGRFKGIDVELMVEDSLGKNAHRFNVALQEVAANDPNIEPFLEASQAGSVIQLKGSSPVEFIDVQLKAMIAQIRNSGKPFISDISLEAFIEELTGSAQKAQAAGGLGFLTGETWGAYRYLDKFSAMGVMPLYEYYFSPEGEFMEIDWSNEEGIKPVMVKDEKTGRTSILSINVSMKDGTEEHRVKVYWINRNGTPVFLLRSSDIFNRLYPGGEHQIKQYALIARSYVELMKKLNLSPKIVRLNEPQLVFVGTAIKNDIDWSNGQRESNVFKDTVFSMTTHTPESAALPYWSVDWLKSVIGHDLVRDWDGAREIIVDGLNGNRIVHAAIGLARLTTQVPTSVGATGIINGVALEHKDVTKEVILPDFDKNIIGIQNGSDPSLWYSKELSEVVNSSESLTDITGKQLFEIGQRQKILLNQYLKGNFGSQFKELNRPLVGLVRRLVAYKEQGILFPIVHWITGDRSQEYETPWGMRKGLGANLLVGGLGRDEVGEQWVTEFKQLMNSPQLKGKLIFVNESGIELMRLATSASDIWVSMPRATREASGTSDQRAALNGHYNIATATGGPLAYIKQGQTGWLIDVFKGRDFKEVVRRFDSSDPKIIEEFKRGSMEELAEYLKDGVSRYFDYTENKNQVWINGMAQAFVDSHQEVSIEVMIQKYGLLFESIVDQTGAEGYETKYKQWLKTRKGFLEFKRAAFGNQVSQTVSSPISFDSYAGFSRKETEEQIKQYRSDGTVFQDVESIDLSFYKKLKKALSFLNLENDLVETFQIIENAGGEKGTTFGISALIEKKIFIERTFLMSIESIGNPAGMKTRILIHSLLSGTNYKKRVAEYEYAKKNYPEAVKDLLPHKGDTIEDVLNSVKESLLPLSYERLERDPRFDEYDFIEPTQETLEAANALMEVAQESMYKIGINALNKKINTRKRFRISATDAPFSEEEKLSGVRAGTLAFAGNPATMAHFIVAGLQAMAEGETDVFYVLLTKGDFRKLSLLESYGIRYDLVEKQLKKITFGLIEIVPTLEEDSDDAHGLNGEEKIIPLSVLNSEREHTILYGAGGDHNYFFSRDEKTGDMLFDDNLTIDNRYYIEMKGYRELIRQLLKRTPKDSDLLTFKQREILDTLVASDMTPVSFYEAQIEKQNFSFIPRLDVLGKIYLIRTGGKIVPSKHHIEAIITPRGVLHPDYIKRKEFETVFDVIDVPVTINPEFKTAISSTNFRKGLVDLADKKIVNINNLLPSPTETIEYLMSDGNMNIQYLRYLIRMLEKTLHRSVKRMLPRGKQSVNYDQMFDNLKSRISEIYDDIVIEEKTEIRNVTLGFIDAKVPYEFDVVRVYEKNERESPLLEIAYQVKSTGDKTELLLSAPIIRGVTVRNYERPQIVDFLEHRVQDSNYENPEFRVFTEQEVKSYKKGKSGLKNMRYELEGLIAEVKTFIDSEKRTYIQYLWYGKTDDKRVRTYVVPTQESEIQELEKPLIVDFLERYEEDSDYKDSKFKILNKKEITSGKRYELDGVVAEVKTLDGFKNIEYLWYETFEERNAYTYSSVGRQIYYLVLQYIRKVNDIGKVIPGAFARLNIKQQVKPTAEIELESKINQASNISHQNGRFEKEPIKTGAILLLTLDNQVVVYKRGVRSDTSSDTYTLFSSKKHNQIRPTDVEEILGISSGHIIGQSQLVKSYVKKGEVDYEGEEGFVGSNGEEIYKYKYTGVKDVLEVVSLNMVKVDISSEKIKEIIFGFNITSISDGYIQEVVSMEVEELLRDVEEHPQNYNSLSRMLFKSQADVIRGIVASSPIGKTVLVVDDSPTNRYVFKRDLVAKGFDVVEAVDGLEALSKLGEHSDIDLVLTDLQMPNMDGVGLVEEMAKQGIKQPIVMITGEVQVEDKYGDLIKDSNNSLVGVFSRDREGILRALAKVQKESERVSSSPIGTVEIDPNKPGLSESGVIDEITEKILEVNQPSRLEIAAPDSPSLHKEIKKLGFETSIPHKMITDRIVELYARRKIADVQKGSEGKAYVGPTREFTIYFNEPIDFFGQEVDSIRLFSPNDSLLDSVDPDSFNGENKQNVLFYRWDSQTSYVEKGVLGKQEAMDILRDVLKNFESIGLFPLVLQNHENRRVLLEKLPVNEFEQSILDENIKTEKDVFLAERQKEKDRRESDALAVQKERQRNQLEQEQRTTQSTKVESSSVDYGFQKKVLKEFIRPIGPSGYVVSNYLFNAFLEVFGETQSEIVEAISSGSESLNLLLSYLKEQSMSDQESNEYKTYEALFLKRKDERKSKERLEQLFADVRKGTVLLLISKKDLFKSSDKIVSYLGQLAWKEFYRRGEKRADSFYQVHKIYADSILDYFRQKYPSLSEKLLSLNLNGVESEFMQMIFPSKEMSPFLRKETMNFIDEKFQEIENDLSLEERENLEKIIKDLVEEISGVGSLKKKKERIVKIIQKNPELAFKSYISTMLNSYEFSEILYGIYEEYQRKLFAVYGSEIDQSSMAVEFERMKITSAFFFDFDHQTGVLFEQENDYIKGSSFFGIPNLPKVSELLKFADTLNRVAKDEVNENTYLMGVPVEGKDVYVQFDQEAFNRFKSEFDPIVKIGMWQYKTEGNDILLLDSNSKVIKRFQNEDVFNVVFASAFGYLVQIFREIYQNSSEAERMVERVKKGIWTNVKYSRDNIVINEVSISRRKGALGLDRGVSLFLKSLLAVQSTVFENALTLSSDPLLEVKDFNDARINFLNDPSTSLRLYEMRAMLPGVELEEINVEDENVEAARRVLNPGGESSSPVEIKSILASEYLNVLNGKDKEERLKMLKRLAENALAGDRSSEAVLIESLSHPKEDVRQKSIKYLGQVGGAKVIKALLQRVFQEGVMSALIEAGVTDNQLSKRYYTIIVTNNSVEEVKKAAQELLNLDHQRSQVFQSLILDVKKFTENEDEIYQLIPRALGYLLKNKYFDVKKELSVLRDKEGSSRQGKDSFVPSGMLEEGGVELVENQATSSPVVDFVDSQNMDNVTKVTPGGIDLNPNLLDLQIKRDGSGIPLPLSQQSIELMNIEGFLPVIINVTPITNLPLLLGFDMDESSDTKESFDVSSLGPVNRIDYYFREESLDFELGYV